jgi:sugar lactone lactonase YvrE
VATYSGGEILRFDLSRKPEVFLSGLSVVAGLYFDWQGNLLVAERGKSRVLSVSPDGKSRVLADQGMSTPVAAIQTGGSSYVIADITGSVLHFDARTKRMKIISNTLRSPAVGLVLDPKGQDAVYAVDYGGKGVYRITLDDGQTRMIESSLISPVGLAMDKKGMLYVGTWSDNCLYRLAP